MDYCYNKNCLLQGYTRYRLTYDMNHKQLQEVSFVIENYRIFLVYYNNETIIDIDHANKFDELIIDKIVNFDFYNISKLTQQIKTLILFS